MSDARAMLRNMTNDARAAAGRLAALLDRERGSLAEFLLALAAFDRQRLWIPLGYSSLFYFLVRELRLSKAAAQYRKVAAELIQQVPAVIEPIRDGRLCLTSIVEAARVVTPENFVDVLPRFFGLSRREAMEIVAELQPCPAPAVRTVVTSSPPRASWSAPGRDGGEECAGELPLSAGSPDELTPRECEPSPGSPDSVTEPTPRWPAAPARSQLTAPQRPAEIVPLTARERRLHVTVSDRFLRKLSAARDLMAHVTPQASEEAILEAGLDLLLARAQRRRGARVKTARAAAGAGDAGARGAAGGAAGAAGDAGDGGGADDAGGADHAEACPPRSPSQPPSRPPSRSIPASVRRAVWLRDQGRCQWPLASGGICGATGRLQLDHIRPVALGGESTEANLRVACAFHNTLAARVALGDRVMDRFTSVAAPARGGGVERGGRASAGAGALA